MGDEHTYFCPHCLAEHPVTVKRCPATSMEVPAVHRMTGRIIDGRYRVGQQIGQGAMGLVYEGEHEQLGRKLAIKFIKPQAMATEVALQRFQNEARIAGSVGHRNIRGIVDMGITDGGLPYIVMHYLEGRSLGEVLRDQGALRVRDAVEIAIQVLEALRVVHERDIVHRDIKPDNIFLSDEPGGGATVKVLDFGLSRLSKDPEGRKLDLTRPGSVMGTPRYMSPEQAQCSKGVDHRTDIFSVGVLLYRMITGKKRFDEWDHESYVSAQTLAVPPRPESFSPHRKLPEALAEIIMKAMAWDPESRFSDAKAFIDALAPFRFSGGLIGDPEGEDEAFKDSSMELGELARRLREGGKDVPRRKFILGQPWIFVLSGVALVVLATSTVFIVLKVSAIERKVTIIERKTQAAHPDAVTVTIEGAPPGASVYVDGVLHPERPLIIHGPSGEHSIEVKADGYETTRHKVDGTADLHLYVKMRPE